MNTRGMTEDMSSFEQIDWANSQFFFEDNFGFLNYDMSEDMLYDVNNMVKNILYTNSDYLSAGFPDSWYNNASHGAGNSMFGGYSSFDMMRNVKLEYNNNTVTATINKDEAYKINNIGINNSDETTVSVPNLRWWNKGSFSRSLYYPVLP
jgi:hypothetical protein